MRRLLGYGLVGGALGLVAALMGAMTMPTRKLDSFVVGERIDVRQLLTYDKTWGVLSFLFLGGLVCGCISCMATYGRGLNVQFRSFILGLVLGAPLCYGASALQETVALRLALSMDRSGYLTLHQFDRVNTVGVLLYYALVPLALALVMTVVVGVNRFTLIRGLLASLFSSVLSFALTHIALTIMLPWFFVAALSKNPGSIDISMFDRPLLIANLFGMGFGVALAFGLAQLVYKPAWLRGMGGMIEGRSFELPAQGFIGCEEGAFVRLPPDGTIALVHAWIHQVGEGHVIEPSQGEVRVNGAPVHSHRLVDLDTVEIGSCRLQYRTRLPHARAPVVGVELPKTVSSNLTLLDPMGQLHVLSSGTLILGRDPGLDISLPWEPTVSRRHLRLTVTPAEVVVTDLGSSNGTFVNNQRVTTSALRNGDRLQLGQCILRVGQERSPS